MVYFKYHSTNCFFVRSSWNQRLLAVDAGWPNTLYEYARNMKAIGCKLEEVAWAVVTHFHMDHAGLISEFLARGVSCFIFENQVAAVDSMERTILKNDKTYKLIDKERLRPINTKDSRAALAEIGIKGEVVVTDYHSPDSISFISDDGEAIIGDLPPEGQRMPDDNEHIRIWELIRKMGAKTVYPSHAGVFTLEDKTDR
jgi:ribonuclease/clavin/mitogillin